MGTKYKVLIVDDSTVFRSQIRAALERCDEIEVVGFASNGKLAIEVLKSRPVDLLTLDLEMPEMNGLQTLAEMAKLGLKAKTIVFSAHTKSGAESTLAALNAGASDFLAKPVFTNLGGRPPSELIRELLLPKILQFVTNKPQSVKTTAAEPLSATPSEFNRLNLDLFIPKVVVIASSTGGPNALEKFFSSVKLPLYCPILIAQHMPPVFTASLAERLQKLTGIPMREAVHQEALLPGCVYIAPGDYHMRLSKNEKGHRILLDQTEQRNSVRPAADHLFESAAALFKEQCLGIVLTGMGADGRDGSVAIKRAGGAVMIQNKETCVVFGMPGAVFEVQAYDKMASLEELAAQLGSLGATGAAKAA